MQQHPVLGVVVGVLAFGSVAATAQASAPVVKSTDAADERAVKATTTKGTMVSYKGGKLRVAVGKRRVDYLVGKGTSCGYSRGNRGTGIRCSSLGQKQYLSKPVRVAWYTDARKRRVATIVAVILAPRR